jgi:hypothetical protein
MITLIVMVIGFLVGYLVREHRAEDDRRVRDKQWRKALMQCAVTRMKAEGLDVREDMYCPDDRIYIVPKS